MNYYQMILQGLSENYYEDNIDITKYDIFRSPNSYIEDYFKMGNKLNSLVYDEKLLLRDSPRATHMCTLYALGSFLITQTNIGQLIKGKYISVIPQTPHEIYENNALYYWFLGSLYHDIGYRNDEYKLSYNLLSFKHSIKKLINNIENSYDYCQSIKELFKKYLDDRFDESYKIKITKNLPYRKYVSLTEPDPYIFNSYYPHLVYRQYYRFRNDELKRKQSNYENVEHGIYGGMIFFNNMIQVLENSLKDVYETNGDYVKTNSNLIWFPEQIDIFRDISLTIATHNLYKDAFKKYKIRTKFRYIQKNNPLLFLLCVCDNIDPYKYLVYKKNLDDNNEIIEHLKKLNVVVSDEKLILESKDTLFSDYFNNLITKLTDYIDIMCTQENTENTYKVVINL